MEKELERREKLKEMSEEERSKAEKEHVELEKKHKDHPQINHPVSSTILTFLIERKIHWILIVQPDRNRETRSSWRKFGRRTTDLTGKTSTPRLSSTSTVCFGSFVGRLLASFPSDDSVLRFLKRRVIAILPPWQITFPLWSPYSYALFFQTQMVTGCSTSTNWRPCFKTRFLTRISAINFSINLIIDRADVLPGRWRRHFLRCSWTRCTTPTRRRTTWLSDSRRWTAWGSTSWTRSTSTRTGWSPWMSSLRAPSRRSSRTTSLGRWVRRWWWWWWWWWWWLERWSLMVVDRHGSQDDEVLEWLWFGSNNYGWLIIIIITDD